METVTYLLRNIPAPLWRRAKAYAAKNNSNMRELIIALITNETAPKARKGKAK